MLNEIKHGKCADTLISIIVFGCIWGFLEATVGGLLHSIHFPYKGAIMGGIAMSIMATFVAVQEGRPDFVIGLGFVAALFKPLDALAVGAPVLAPFVTNPAIAIIMEALAFTLAAGLLFKGTRNTVRVHALVGGLAGYLSIAFYGITASVVGLGGWLGMGLEERVTYGLVNGTAVAVLGATLVPLGWIAGSDFRPRLLHVKETIPRVYYMSAAVVSSLCSVVTVLAFTHGY